jgi:hypothetical protein
MSPPFFLLEPAVEHLSSALSPPWRTRSCLALARTALRLKLMAQNKWF